MEKEWVFFGIAFLIGFFVCVFYCISKYYNLIISIILAVTFLFIDFILLRNAVKKDLESTGMENKKTKNNVPSLLRKSKEKEKNKDVNYIAFTSLISFIIAFMVGLIISDRVPLPFSLSTSITITIIILFFLEIFFLRLRFRNRK